MATAVRVRFPPSAPARHQGLWQLAATLSFFPVSSSTASQASPLFFLPLRIWVKQVVQKVPQMPSAAASSAHPHSTCHSHPATRRSGQHLLCVGRIFYFRCALPAAVKKRLGNAEIRLSLGTCFRQEAKLLACRLFALLHASLPGVPDLPTLRHILVRHLSSMQGKDVSPPDSTDKNVLLFPLVEDNRGCRASAPHYSEPRTARYWGATNLRNIPSETSCPQAATI